MRIKKIIFGFVFLAGISSIIFAGTANAATSARALTEYGPTQVNGDAGIIIEYIFKVTTTNGTPDIPPTATSAGVGTVSLPSVMYIQEAMIYIIE